MNYIDKVKEQIISYMMIILLCLASRQVIQYMASDYTPLIITWDHIITFTVMSLWYIFLTPLYIERFKQSAFCNPWMGFEIIKTDTHKKDPHKK